VDELTLVMSVVQELRTWGPVDHIRSNLEITAGIYVGCGREFFGKLSCGTLDVYSSVNCWRSPARSDVLLHHVDSHPPSITRVSRVG